MRNFIKVIAICFLVCASAGAETLAEALAGLESRAETIAARQQGETWGVKTAQDDLRRLVAQSQRLSAALTGTDAREVKMLEAGLRSAARRLKTSKAMLSSADEAEVDQLLVNANEVAETLTDLRLRFGSQANSVSGDLSGVVVGEDVSLGYDNLQALLVDVRWARQLAAALQPLPFPNPGAFGFAQPGNLDPRQMRRVAVAGWKLERRLSGKVADVQQSIPEWRRFKKEYDRLGNFGTTSNARKMERVMRRLNKFYAQYEV